MTYPTHFRIGFHERQKLREILLNHVIYQPGPNSGTKPNCNPNRNDATSPSNRQHLRNSGKNRSRTPSPNKENANTRGYRPQIHGQYITQSRPYRSRSRSKYSVSEDEYLHKRYPTRHRAQQQHRSREISPGNSEDDAPQTRYKISPGGYYRSPNYLKEPSKIQEQKAANSKTQSESTTGRENRKRTKKLKIDTECSQFRPDYILGQRDASSRR